MELTQYVKRVSFICFSNQINTFFEKYKFWVQNSFFLFSILFDFVLVEMVIQMH